jgi:secreted protein with Ig-like and vWFA domain
MESVHGVMHTGVNGIEEVGTLLGLLDVGINEERVGLGVDVLHHDLKTVEAAGLGDLNLTAEALQQVLVDNTVGSGEEGQNVGDEVTLVIVQAVVPVVQILGQINFLGGPERGLGLLVHLPDLWG